MKKGKKRKINKNLEFFRQIMLVFLVLIILTNLLVGQFENLYLKIVDVLFWVVFLGFGYFYFINQGSYFEKSWKFIKDSKIFILWIIGLFLFFALLGFFIPLPESFVEMLIEQLEELVRSSQGFNALEMIGFIFWNNLKASFFGMIYGFFFGIFPIISSIFNGFVVGFVSYFAVDRAGILSLLNLVPHGIFELPAVFISLGMGLKFGTFVFKKNKKFMEFLVGGLRAFLFIVIPLLVIAAVIEGILIVLAN